MSKPGDSWTELSAEAQAAAEALCITYVQTSLICAGVQMEQLLHTAQVQETGEEGGFKFRL